MITFPNAKINLGLSITARRPDGYHDLQTVFYPVALTDALEITPLPATDATATHCTFHTYGIPLEGESHDNLVLRAYRLLAAQYPLPLLDIHLYKHIPSGAGLGGGSADAAFMLRMLNERYALQLTTAQLEAYAATLGADCAFFIRNRPTYAQGIGNLFTPISLSLTGYRILLIKPDVFVSTREAFAHVRPAVPAQSVDQLIQRPVSEWRDCLFNDFEASVFPQYPALAALKEELYRRGAVYASMSGSGSSVYGLFAPDAPLPDTDWVKDSFTYTGEL